MKSFHHWLRSAPGILVLAATLSFAIVKLDPPDKPLFLWLAYTTCILPVLGARSPGRCRTPRWLGGRGAGA